MIHFDEKEHKYYDGLTELISVTQLLKKHGLSTDFSAVPERILNAAAEKGTAIHKRIENYVNTGQLGDGEYQDHLQRFVDVFGRKFVWSEIIVGNDVVAGTVDLIGYDVVADVKTGSTINKESWAWQLSIYEYLIRHGLSEEIDPQDEPYTIGVIRLTDNECEWVHLNNIPDEEIERLFECERNGELYTQQLIPSDLALKVEQAEQSLAIVETAKKSAEETAKKYRAELLEYMEKNNIKQFKGEKVTVTYVAPQIRSGYDMKALELYHSDILHKYPKNTEVKASLRITVKE